MKKLGLAGTLLTLCMLISFTKLPDAQAHPASAHTFAVKASHTDQLHPEHPYPCRNQHPCHNQQHHNNHHHNQQHHNNHHHNQQHNGYDTTTTAVVPLPSGTQMLVARLPLPGGHFVVDASIPIEFVTQVPAQSVPAQSTPLFDPAGQVTCSFSVENGLTDGLQPAIATTSVSTTSSEALYRTLPLTDSVTIFPSRGVVSLVCTFTLTEATVTTTALAGTSITADQQNQLTFIPQ